MKPSLSHVVAQTARVTLVPVKVVFTNARPAVGSAIHPRSDHPEGNGWMAETRSGATVLGHVG